MASEYDVAAPDVSSVDLSLADPRLRSCILVLGMHRSGTSAVCGILSELGAERPLRELPPAPDNPKGFFEPAEIVAIHDRLLESAGSHWNDWDPIATSWFESAAHRRFVDELAEAVRHDFPGEGPFFLKDPRVCRFVPLWLSVLRRVACEPVVLFQFRDPFEVALSLKSREGFSIDHGLLLWLRHVLDAEYASRGLERSFVSYAAILLDWHSELSPAIRRLWPRLPRQSARASVDVEQFVDDTLRHHRRRGAVGTDTHEWIARTWDALMLLREDPHAATAIATLDAVRAEFDRACRAFTTVTQGLLAGARRVAQAHLDERARQEALSARAQALEGELSQARSALESVAPSAARVPELDAELHRLRQIEADLRPMADRVPVLEAEAVHLREEAAAQAAAATIRISELEVDAAHLRKESAAQVATVSGRISELEAEAAHLRAVHATQAAAVAHVSELELQAADHRAAQAADLNCMATLEEDLDTTRRDLAVLTPTVDRAVELERTLAEACQSLAALRAELDDVRATQRRKLGARLRSIVFPRRS